MLLQGYSGNPPLKYEESRVIVGNWSPAWSQGNTRTPGQRTTIRENREQGRELLAGRKWEFHKRLCWWTRRKVCNSKQAAKSQAQYNHQNAKILISGVLLYLNQEIFPMTQEGRNPKKVSDTRP